MIGLPQSLHEHTASKNIKLVKPQDILVKREINIKRQKL